MGHSPDHLPAEGTICLQCGDRGYANAFVYCVGCLQFAVHRYCLDTIPKTFDEFVRWFCDDCKVKYESLLTVQDSKATKHVLMKAKAKKHESSIRQETCAKNESIETSQLTSESTSVKMDLQKKRNSASFVVEEVHVQKRPLLEASKKSTGLSFSVWPPVQQTRDAVINRLVETFSTPSVLTTRYGTLPPEEASEVAKRVEEEALNAAWASAYVDDDDLHTFRVYTKETSKRMHDAIKSRIRP